MSLLLDALNRAGKDKAAAAAADTAGADTAWPALGLLPQSTESEPKLPEASLTTPATPLAVDKESPSLVVAEGGLSLEPVATLPESAVEAPAPPSPASTPAAPAAAKPTSAAAALQPDKIAQTILRAKSAPGMTTSRRPRLLALGGLAGLMAAGLASVFLGWVDPFALISSKPGLGPSGQMAAVTTPTTNNTPPTTVAAAPAAVTVEPPPQPIVAPSAPTHQSADVVLSRKAPSSKSKANAAAPGRSEPAVAGKSAKTAAPATTASAPKADCSAGSLSPDCQQPMRPVAKAKPKPVAPKPPEPLPTLIAKAIGPSQLEVAYAALTQGRMDEAAAAYKAALAANPDERDALLGLAYIAHLAAREEEARDLYRQVLRQEPGNPTARAGLLIQTLSNDVEDVSNSSRDVAEQHPGSAAAQSVLGHSLVRQGRLADAQQAFQRAYVLEPGVAMHAYNLAVAFDRLRSYGAARAHYERALALSRQNGSESNSGFSHLVVENRLKELVGARPPDSPATR